MKKYVTISFNDFVRQKLHEAKELDEQEDTTPPEEEQGYEPDAQNEDEEEEIDIPISKQSEKEKKPTNKKPKFGASDYIQELKREFEAIMDKYPE